MLQSYIKSELNVNANEQAKNAEGILTINQDKSGDFQSMRLIAILDIIQTDQKRLTTTLQTVKPLL